MGKPTLKERVAEIEFKMDRTGLPPLATDERIQLLNEIYDGLLYRWKQAVLTGAAAGTGALTLQIERARLELESLNGSNAAGSTYTIKFMEPESSEAVA